MRTNKSCTNPLCLYTRSFLLCLLPPTPPLPPLPALTAGEIKMHPWFHGVDWTSLARNKAAFVPVVDSDTDTWVASVPAA